MGTDADNAGTHDGEVKVIVRNAYAKLCAAPAGLHCAVAEARERHLAERGDLFRLLVKPRPGVQVAAQILDLEVCDVLHGGLGPARALAKFVRNIRERFRLQLTIALKIERHGYSARG